MEENIKIYVNTWGNYNENGACYGAWLSLPMDPDDLEEKLEKIAERMGDHDPEWFINDTDINFPMDVGENDSIFELNEIAEEIESLDDYDREKLAAVLEAMYSDPHQALSTLSKVEFYPDMTIKDYAYMLVENNFPDADNFLLRYFDYDSYARDLSIEGCAEVNGGVLVEY